MTLRNISKLAVTGLDDLNQRRRLVEVVNQITEPPTWIAPTLLNSWVNYGIGWAPAGYYKDVFGRVHFRGLIENGSTAFPTALFVLPAGYRPPGHVMFNQRISNATQTADAAGRIDVNSDGTVSFILADVAGAGDGCWASLNGISFLAEQ